MTNLGLFNIIGSPSVQGIKIIFVLVFSTVASQSFNDKKVSILHS